MIFSDDMFGSAMGDPENTYQINSGWFKDITSLYDPDFQFEVDFIEPGHNAFGFIDAQFNYQSLSGIARTNSYCGLKGEMEFATCNKLIGCFDDNDNIYEWTVCMEDQVSFLRRSIIIQNVPPSTSNVFSKRDLRVPPRHTRVTSKPSTFSHVVQSSYCVSTSQTLHRSMPRTTE